MRWQDKFLLFFISIIINCLKLAPNWLKKQLALIFTSLYLYFPSKEKEITKLHLKKFMPHITNNQSVKGVFFSTALTAFEAICAKRLLNNIEIEGGEELVDVFSKNKAILGLTAHIGSWELLASYISNYYKNRFVVIGRNANKEWLQKLLYKIREQNAIKTIWRSGGFDSMRQIKKHWSKNYIIGALIDQDTKVSSINVDFFNLPAKTPATLVKAAKRNNADIIIAFLIRIEPFKRYKAVFKIINPENSIEQILYLYNNFLEDTIKKYPNQWVWFHKRWRSAYWNKPLSSKEYIQWLKNNEVNSQ